MSSFIARRVFTLVVVSLVSFSSFGQMPAKSARLDPIAVTASRTAQPVSDLLADVTVIGPDDIARAGQSSLAELLARQPGVEIATNGEDCHKCLRRLRPLLMKINGVEDVTVDLENERIVVTYDARKTHPPDLHDAILNSGYRPGMRAD